MNNPLPTQLPVIKELSSHTVNLIAAGEVVEKPASVVKELVENALDALASQIIIHIQNGGTELISVTDNGHGIEPQSIPLAAKRHATSKLPDNNLAHINSFGFRGEALASIIAVSETSIASRTEQSENSWSVSFQNEQPSKPQPIKHFTPHGTKITVQNLFHNIPARKTFLRSVTVETKSVIAVFKDLALSSLPTAFTLFVDGKKRFDLPSYPPEHHDPLGTRISQIIGDNFIDNAFDVDFSHDSFPLSIKGRLGFPTFNSSYANTLHIFINNRIVKDKVLNAVIRSAYGDTLPRGRYPHAVLFFTIDPLYIDVNAHPSKTEIRLRQPVETKNIIRHAIKNLLRDTPTATSSHLASQFVHAAKPPQTHTRQSSSYPSKNTSPSFTQAFHENLINQKNPPPQNSPPQAPIEEEIELLPKSGPLGEARSQIMGNYIIAETQDSLVIVDQHAAHERILYEQLKNQLAQSAPLPSQMSLVPRSVPCESPENVALIIKHQSLWEQFGFSITPHKEDRIRISAAPSILKDTIPERIILDVIDALSEDASATEEIIKEHIFRVLSKAACHQALRGYTPLTLSEMNALLRNIEQSPLASQCNHGRPSFVTLKLKDLESLFERR
jgi:DNA mismatch repair protein MutL